MVNLSDTRTGGADENSKGSTSNRSFDDSPFGRSICCVSSCWAKI